jgi:hypothetical protein
MLDHRCCAEMGRESDGAPIMVPSAMSVGGEWNPFVLTMPVGRSWVNPTRGVGYSMGQGLRCESKVTVTMRAGELRGGQ